MKKIKALFFQRNLLYHLALRELKIRYKYPFLGFLWMFFVPLAMVFIFKIVFSTIIKISVPVYPFFIYLITGVFPWNYLAMSLSQATTSLVDNSNLIKKVYFPREIVPFSILLGNLFSFSLSMLIVLIILPVCKIKLNYMISFLPLVITLETLFIAGIVLVSSSLQVLYRDVKYIVEIILLLWFYITPIFYPLSLVEDISPKFLKLYLLNPFTSLITLYRLVLLPNFFSTLPKTMNLSYLVSYTIFSCLIFFILGMLVFKRYEPKISDFV
ncbi:MAG: ABC transporter permease [Candidatus Omnitrophica bacterium]|nr:ABC transporter permease [Candidatus Omnitrophota bacterium]MCM8793443.1 ABC transporter permease [Candidatus Omnitrophota bacterium]